MLAAHCRETGCESVLAVGAGKTHRISNHKSDFYVKRSSLECTRRWNNVITNNLNAFFCSLVPVDVNGIGFSHAPLTSTWLHEFVYTRMRSYKNMLLFIVVWTLRVCGVRRVSKEIAEQNSRAENSFIKLWNKREKWLISMPNKWGGHVNTSKLPISQGDLTTHYILPIEYETEKRFRIQEKKCGFGFRQIAFSFL